MTMTKPTIALLALVLANLLPLIGVFVFGWDAGALVLLYWAENGVVGAFAVIKLLSLRESSIGSRLSTVFFMVPFTCAHYGGFWVIHGFLLIYLFGLGEAPPEYEPTDSFLDFVLAPAHMARHVISGVWVNRPAGLEWGLFVLSSSHAISFFHDFLRGGGRAELAPGQLMVHPYLRVFFGTVVVLAGGWAMESGRVSPGLVVLAAVVLFKLLADVFSYYVSHRRRGNRRRNQ
jgi:hypothetical protein